MRLPRIPARPPGSLVFVFLAAALLLIFTAIPARCADINWLGDGTANDWFVASNWDLGRIPVANDRVLIQIANTSNNLVLSADTPNVTLRAVGNWPSSIEINGPGTFYTSGVEVSLLLTAPLVFNCQIVATAPTAFTTDGRGITLNNMVSNGGHLISVLGEAVTFKGGLSGSGGLFIRSHVNFETVAATYTGATQIEEGGRFDVRVALACTNFSLVGPWSADLNLYASDVLPDSATVYLKYTSDRFNLRGFNETIATLSGAGTVTTGTGTLTIATALNPGANIGTITLGNFSLAAAAALNVEINDTAAGTGYDQVRAVGSVTLGGNLNLIPTISPAAGATFTIIDNDGADAVIGTFAGLAEGATITSGGTKYRISYTGGTGNDVTLTSLGPVGGGGSTPTPTPPAPEPTPDPPAAPPVPQGSGPCPTGSLNGPTLTWPHVAGSNFYRVYRAACPACPKQQVGRVTGLSFTDESARPGQVYYYFIRTENPGGLSDYSDWLPAWRYEQNPGRAGDFNGDGVMDLLWWDPDTGELSIWYLNSGAVQSVGSPGQGLDIGQWLLVNTGDFNNDGVCDLLWWNPESGAAAIWYMTATASASGGMGLQAADQAGDITGNVTLSYSGDLNGDGRSDLVWRDYASGEVTLWLMGEDGKPSLSGPPSLAEGMTEDGRPGVSGSLEWTLRGAHDLDADGKADLVWQHATDGRVVVWLMDGARALGFREYRRDDATNWRVAGLGDLDGDGRGDLLWRNDADGRLRAWLMTGGEPAYEERDIALSGGDAAAWQVKAVGSFCRVGCAEAYCKHAESGAARIVNLDGGEFDLAVE